MKIYFWPITFCILNAFGVLSQVNIKSEDFAPFTTHFSLTEEHKIDDEGEEALNRMIGGNQFIGLAELHQSQQLSYFTIGFLDLLKRNGVNHFAIEVGPNSANILQEISSEPKMTSERLKDLNHSYGKRSFPKIPIPFVDKEEDAMFIEKASNIGFKFWGLDQEFSYSYEMLLDRLFLLVKDESDGIQILYKKSKELLKKNLFKKKIDGKSRNCWFLSEPIINEFLDKCKGNARANGIISALRTSWDIYCKNERYLPSNQLRADYMKNNFDSLFHLASKGDGALTKVFVKLGSVHLTRGKSIFGVHDMGEHLSLRAKTNGTGFLAIRHLSKYRNGKNLTGKNGWEGLEIMMSLGRKDMWTVVDLRPIRKKLEIGELKADEKISFEIYNYDVLLIPPDDRRSSLNY